uniref:mitogen-activated protein kinase kinase n=1 Tax=Globodera rostochiensis TaxID=31243 RepID=A0A914H2L6_GLORO
MPRLLPESKCHPAFARLKVGVGCNSPTSSSAAAPAHADAPASRDCSDVRGDVLREEDEEEQDHCVPDGTDIQQISYMRFVRMFMSGRLCFPGDSREHRFGVEDLRDLGEIGAGRFGHVHKMVHVPTAREIAVKICKEACPRSHQQVSGDKSRLKSLSRFDDSDDVHPMRQLQKEVRAIQDASTGATPDVVRYFGLTFHEGDCLICMELMDLSLERLYKLVHGVAKEHFEEVVLGITGITVLNALNDLKELKRIIHRDVKPSNILLNFRGQIKLCDFGISGYLEDSIAKTKDIGCRPYMSPERLTASQDGYDIRTDVWSLGISLIETARGEYPYPDLSSKSFFAQIQQVVFGDPIFMGPVDNYTHKTIQFVNMCLIKEYSDRPTFSDLMLSEFYKFFNAIPDKLEPTRNYTLRMWSLAAGKS